MTVSETEIREPARFYDRYGAIVKEVVKKNGNVGAPTINDMRRLDLRPSVTTVLKVCSPDGAQYAAAAGAALMMEQGRGDPMSIGAAALGQDSPASEFGTAIHKMIEERLLKPDAKSSAPIAYRAWLPFINDFIEKHIKAVAAVELPVVGENYAGTLDVAFRSKCGKMVLGDWKTQSYAKNPQWYRYKWPLQLAAYSRHVDYRVDGLWSIVIPSREPGPLLLRKWEDEDGGIWRWKLAWSAAYDLWKALNNIT